MILAAKDIHKNFYQPHQIINILEGLNLEVSEGETVAILGKSGAGKSTLLSILSGLDSFESGDLQISGQSLGQLSEAELTQFRAKNLGIVFQNFHLLPHLTAMENVALPMEINGIDGFEQRAKKLLDKVGLSHRHSHLPSELSGGEKQRVAVARALATSPKILLADEPSGSLDETTGEEVMSLLFELVEKEKTAMILVTHDSDLAQRCSRRLILDHGKLHGAD